MSTNDDLRNQLERLGRMPAPAPRPEFVEKLLPRLTLLDEVSVAPEPVDLLRRRNRTRVATFAAAAAMVVAAVGFYATTVGDGNDVPVTTLSLSTDARLRVEPPEGGGTDIDQPRQVEAPIGSTVTCITPGQLFDQSGNAVSCVAGEEFVVIDDNGKGKLVPANSAEARPKPTSARSVELAKAGSTTVPTTSQPRVEPTDSGATSGPTGATGSTDVTGSTGSSAAGSAAPSTEPAGAASTATPAVKPQPQAQTTAAPPKPDRTVTLVKEAGGVRVKWAWPARSDDKFHILRTISTTSSAPSTPIDNNQVAQVAGAERSYLDTVPKSAVRVRYRVLVVPAGGGEVEALDEAEATFETGLKPSGELDRPTGEPGEGR
ncbi:MAG: hypothetical protein ACKVWR_11110 [Acidimicrobiales bacterium]